jgi:hypothetical protein
MTDTPVSYLNDIKFANQSIGETSGQDTINACLYWWVSTCLARGEQHLDTMVVTAPYHLKLAFGCYDAMADEIEITVQRIWTDIAMKRLLVVD